MIPRDVSWQTLQGTSFGVDGAAADGGAETVLAFSKALVEAQVDGVNRRRRRRRFHVSSQAVLDSSSDVTAISAIAGGVAAVAVVLVLVFGFIGCRIRRRTRDRARGSNVQVQVQKNSKSASAQGTAIRKHRLARA